MFNILNTHKPTQKKPVILLTLSTCFYVLKSKFSPNTYIEWISNLLSIVRNFNLVIYTDILAFNYIKHIIDIKNKRIKIIFKPLEEFELYKYKDDWIRNHTNSNLFLHENIDWKLNMLWNEKIFFVKDTINKRYFNTIYYGWCDLGYFRNKPNNIHTNYLRNWPNPINLLKFPFINNSIHYARVQKDDNIYSNEKTHVKKHYSDNLETHPSSDLLENYFAGGFFILQNRMIHLYANIYEEKLKYYFKNNYTIKDDQTILLDIIFTNQHLFEIHSNFNNDLEEWFMFQYILL
jgi:hypothetical protein